MSSISSIEAPRVTLGEGATRPVLQFSSWGSLADNLEQRNFKFILVTHSDAVVKDGKEVTRHYHSILGKLDSRAPGYVRIALKTNSLREKADFGGKSVKLYYDFLQPSARDYGNRQNTEDTQDDFDRVYRYLQPIIIEAFNVEHPGQTCSVHHPKALKFAKPTESSEKKYTKTGVVDITPSFDMNNFVVRDGAMQVKIGAPWSMAQASIDNYTVGLKFTVDKSKYFTDAQILGRREAKEEEKKAKEVMANKLKRTLEAGGEEGPAKKNKDV